MRNSGLDRAATLCVNCSAASAPTQLHFFEAMFRGYSSLEIVRIKLQWPARYIFAFREFAFGFETQS